MESGRRIRTPSVCWSAWLPAESPPEARPVLNAFVEEVAKRNMTEKVAVTQTGCIGICQYEPVVEVLVPGQEKVTYVKMTPEKAVRVVNDHLVNGNVVTEFTIGANS